MIDLYFAITGNMMVQGGMPETTQCSAHRVWKLSARTILNNVIATSYGQILDLIHPANETGENFAICKAEVDNEIGIEMIRAGLVGDKVSGLVTVTEILWINKEVHLTK